MAKSKRIEVDLNRQVLLAFDGARQVFSFDCVSGDDAHATPPGLWRILRKHRFYVSRTYHVRMDYAMFFTTTGEAIHQSHFVGPLSFLKYFGASSIGSHGCVRLAEEDAAALFAWTPMGTTVWVH
jgi:lipoprotein-anchoring transpeptidase ErfK/SrfK